MEILISCLVVSILILDIGIILILKTIKESYRNNENQYKEQHYSQDDIILIATHIRDLENKTKHLENQQSTQGYKLDKLYKIIKSGHYF